MAIIPGSARLRYGELLRALEEAYPVSFAGSSRSEIDAADAVIAFACERPYGLRVPCLALEGPGPERERGSPFTVELSRSAGLDRALHSQRLLERHARPPAPVANGAGTRVLATVAGKPVWVQSDAEGVHHETASALPVELEDHEFLRDHLTAGRFWSLLPIVHFLKKLSCGVWTQSHIRPACFVIDDPNVRFSSYGYLSFPELAGMLASATTTSQSPRSRSISWHPGAGQWACSGAFGRSSRWSCTGTTTCTVSWSAAAMRAGPSACSRPRWLAWDASNVEPGSASIE